MPKRFQFYNSWLHTKNYFRFYVDLVRMKKKKYVVIGVMSGTSLDGIDLAWLDFEIENNQWSFQVHAAETIPYSKYRKKELRDAIGYSKEKLERLDFKYTDALADALTKFIQKYGIQTLDAVCSHGHTIFHQPEKGWTCQIGNLPRLAQLIERKVVCDFRIQDVQLGGQGAPLVPIGDRLLFSEYDYCLNLGGFANVSFEKNGDRIAFDICPVNIVLNVFAEKLGKEYDEFGNFARTGTVDSGLLNKLNSLHFYTEHPPKSLGLEWVRSEFFPLLEHSALSIEDILATCTEHMAIQLGKQFSEKSKVLVTGGGAYNQFLMERLALYSQVELVLPDIRIIDYKEAVVFGLLGVLRLRDEINCLASVTGADRNHSSGKIYFP